MRSSPPHTRVMNTMITYEGTIAAFASPLRVHFRAPLADRPADDPVRRFVTAMAAYAHDIHTGELPGPYDDGAAQLYARSVLINDDEFAARAAAGHTDDEMAAHFNVPLEQITRKHDDLEYKP